MPHGTGNFHTRYLVERLIDFPVITRTFVVIGFYIDIDRGADRDLVHFYTIVCRGNCSRYGSRTDQRFGSRNRSGYCRRDPLAALRGLGREQAFFN